MEDKPEILVDTREKDHQIINELENYFSIKTWELLAGDYVLADKEICIELKKAGDFVSSIKDGRLVKQREKMTENFENNYIIIIGDILPWNKTDMSDNAIMGMIASLNIKYDIKTIQVKNQEQFAYMCSRLHKKHKERGDLGPKKHIQTSRNSAFDDYLNMLACIRGVGSGTAKKIADEFPVLSQLTEADKEEIKEVEGVGDKTASNIYETLHEPGEERDKREQILETRKELKPGPEW